MHRGVLTRVALVVVSALCAAAQDDSPKCWFPDKITQPSNHVPCHNPNGGESVCCPADAVCLKSGACYQSGIVIRASCTDKSWTDVACPAFCRDWQPGNVAVLHGCDADPTGRYTCGINSTCNDTNVVIVNGNNDFNFQPAQLEALIASATPSPSSTAPNTPNTGFSAVEMAGVGIGIGIPLIIAIATLGFLLWREKRHVQDIQKQAEKDLLNITSTHQTEIARHENMGYNRGRESLNSKPEQGLPPLEMENLRVPLELDSRYRQPNKGSMSSGSTAVTQQRPELSATASHIFIPKEARIRQKSLENQISPSSSSLYYASPVAGRSSQDIQTRSRTGSSLADPRTSRENMEMHSRSPPTSRSPRGGPSRSSVTASSSRDNVASRTSRDTPSRSSARAGPSREMDNLSRSPPAIGRSSREYQTRSPSFGTYSPGDPSPASSASPVRFREDELRAATRGETASPWDDRTPRWI